jgi:hypothetical protein
MEVLYTIFVCGFMIVSIIVLAAAAVVLLMLIKDMLE